LPFLFFLFVNCYSLISIIHYIVQKNSNIIIKKLEENEHEIKLEWQIHDTGTGISISISISISKQVFKSFTQTEKSTTKQFGGTGLGLSISEGLVELMGGKMWVESMIDKGSSFLFIITLDKVLDKHVQDI